MSREARVGALVLAAVGALALGIFLIGERGQVFLLTNRYSVRFPAVSGLAVGNPVQLSGVTVGSVVDVVLPEVVEEKLLTVWISVDRRFAARVRADSLARIKTLGLLGDKFIEISSGTSEAAVIPSGGEIPAAPATDVDRLITSGEDAVDNVVAISYSLRTILARIEQGEGLLGELLVDTDAAHNLRSSTVATLESLRGLAMKLDEGEGLVGALLTDAELRREGEEMITRLGDALATLEEGGGPLAAVLHDENLTVELEAALRATRAAAESVAATAEELREGTGLVGRLVTDEELAAQVTEDLRRLLEDLASVAAALDRGDGTLARLLRDPDLFEAIDDVVVGIDESKFLRWLVRNRQRAGIRKRYREEHDALREAPVEDQAPPDATAEH